MASYSFYLEQEDGIYRYIFQTQIGVRYAVYFAAEWFNDFNADSRFYKEDAELILPAANIKVSLLLLTQHADFAVVMQEFHEVRNKLVSEK